MPTSNKNSSKLKIDLPSTLSHQSTNFGFGKRRPIDPIKLRNASETPSPNTYNLLTDFNKISSIAKSFGLSYNSW